MSSNDKRKTVVVKSSARGDLAACLGAILLVVGAMIATLGLGYANTAGGSTCLIWIGGPIGVIGLFIILGTVIKTRQ